MPQVAHNNIKSSSLEVCHVAFYFGLEYVAYLQLSTIPGLAIALPGLAPLLTLTLRCSRQETRSCERQDNHIFSPSSLANYTCNLAFDSSIRRRQPCDSLAPSLAAREVRVRRRFLQLVIL